MSKCFVSTAVKHIWLCPDTGKYHFGIGEGSDDFEDEEINDVGYDTIEECDAQFSEYGDWLSHQQDRSWEYS